MALAIFTWDLPSGERVQVYEAKAHTEWIQNVLQQPGVTEVRAYRNPHHTTPQVMIHIEFDSLAAWQEFLTSERYGELMFDLRAVGCTHMTVQVWDTSPLLPQPVRPSAG
jgi:heme-degrading monooxygenase HmoA